MTDARAALALHAAALLAVDPFGLGGAVLRGPVCLARDAWLEAFRAMLPAGVPWRRMPPQIADGRLLGGLDLAATLAAGRPIAERGLLAEADGGTLIVPMAERLGGSTTSYLGAALDLGEVIVERDGIARRSPTRFAAILLDEGMDDEQAPPPLTERVAFALDLAEIGPRSLPQSPHGEEPPQEASRTMRANEPEHIAAARARVATIVAGDEAVEALAAAGVLFGVPSLRLATLALRAAKAAAALAGRDRVSTEDAELAAALVIAPRATRLPASDEDEKAAEPEPPPEPPEAGTPDDPSPADPTEAQTMAESVVEATRAAIPADLLATLAAAAGLPRQGMGGRAGAPRQSARRGRPAGTRRGTPGHGVRLAVVETLRAAAPWQKLRRQAIGATIEPTRPLPLAGKGRGGGRAVRLGLEEAERTPIPSPSLTRSQACLTSRDHKVQLGQARVEGGRGPPNRILVRREDFRVGRFKQKSETLTIFVVDASGSAALHRLAEVKGAVELVLADCYVRRDGVALIAFRGERAELVLPPTRSLVRAKRALSGLPGGGGTPLAAAIDAAGLLAQAARKKGQAPLVVLLTDGKANVARTGRRPGRAAAEADAALAAQAFRLGGAAALVLDIAPRPGDAARRLATAMGARYIPLPYADARVLSRTVLAAGSAA